MLIKEFKNIGMQAGILLSITLMVTIFLFYGQVFVTPDAEFFGIFFVLFQVGLLSWAYFMGIAIFSNEVRQGGMDYLLSLPYSRYQLLAVKAVPRLVAVALMYLLYLALYHMGGITASLMGKMAMSVWYVVIFSLALSMSTLSDNFLKLSMRLFVFLSLVGAVLYFLVIFTFRLRAGSDMGIGALDLLLVGTGNDYLGFVYISLLFLVLPFLVAFVAHFKRFDASYSRENRRRYYKILIPTLVIGVLLSFFTAYRSVKSEYQSYYLTDDYQLIKSDEFNSRIYDGENVREIKGINSFGYPFLEFERYIYKFSYEPSHGSSFSRLVRLDKKDLSVQDIYEGVPYKLVLRRGWVWKNDIVFLEWDRKEGLNIVRLDRDDYGVRKINVPWEVKKKRQKPLLFGADEINGKEFFVIQMLSKLERSVLRVWADGRSEWLDIDSISPLYAGGILLAPSKGGPLRFWKLNETGAELLKEVPVDLRFYSYYWQSKFNLKGCKEVCGVLDRKLFRVDLQELTVDLISDSAAYARQASPADGIYYAQMGTPYLIKSINRFVDGKIEAVKELNLDTLKRGNSCRIFKNGAVIEQDGKVRVFAFPDFREITYQKLK